MVISVIGNKESIHLKLVVAEEVENGVGSTLEGVAENSSSRQPDGKVWIRANASLLVIVCSPQSIIMYTTKTLIVIYTQPWWTPVNGSPKVCIQQNN